MSTAAGVPRRALVVLVGLVLLAHVLLLRGAPELRAWSRPGPPTTLQLRSVAGPTPTPTQAPLAPLPSAAGETGAQGGGPGPTPRTASPAPSAERARAQQPRSQRAATTSAPAAPAPAPARPPQRPGPSTAAATADPPQHAAAALPAASAAASVTASGPAPLAAMLDLLRPPAPALWRYDVAARHRGSLLAGQATLHWRHDGDHYEALAQWSLPSLPGRRQLSTGALSAQGLAPTRFSDRLRSEEAAHFDRAGGRIVFSSNRPDAPLRPGSQDRLSVLLQLASLVGGAPQRFMPGAVVVVPTGTRDAADWRFVVEDFETLALPAGTVRALRITRAPEREYDLRIELWLAPGADYAPVRLRLTTPNGDWLDWQWSGTDKG